MNYVDTHLHVLPSVDDGPSSIEESKEVLAGLKSLGFDRVVSTFHLNAGRESRIALARSAYDALVDEVDPASSAVVTGFTAEHLLDGLFWDSLRHETLLCYPNTRYLLVECGFRPGAFPPNLEQLFFKLQLKRYHPVFAHPERYDEFRRRPDLVDVLRQGGTLMQLDLLSLVGAHGRKTQKTARKWLAEDVYDIAASDVHTPLDLDMLEKSINYIKSEREESAVERLLVEMPKKLLKSVGTGASE